MTTKKITELTCNPAVRVAMFRAMVEELDPQEILNGLATAYCVKSQELLGLLGGMPRSEKMLLLVRDLRALSTEGV